MSRQNKNPNHTSAAETGYGIQGNEAKGKSVDRRASARAQILVSKSHLKVLQQERDRKTCICS